MASGQAIYAVARMFGQLMLIGYCLIYLFETESGWVVAAVLAIMVMCMVYGATGIASACFLTLSRNDSCV